MTQEPLATIGYQIEFDETGQILRLRNEQASAETNTTLSVLAACLITIHVLLPIKIDCLYFREC